MVNPFPPINFNVSTDPNYWQSSAIFPPKPAKPRVNRLLNYRDLYDGVFSSVGIRESAPVQENRYSLACDQWATFVNGLPPRVVPAREGLTLDEELLAYLNGQLDDTIDSLIVDFIRYGTGLVHGWIDEDGLPRVETLSPTYWFPWSSDAQGSTHARILYDGAGEPEAVILRFMAPDLDEEWLFPYKGESLGSPTLLQGLPAPRSCPHLALSIRLENGSLGPQYVSRTNSHRHSDDQDSKSHRQCSGYLRQPDPCSLRRGRSSRKPCPGSTTGLERPTQPSDQAEQIERRRAQLQREFEADNEGVKVREFNASSVQLLSYDGKLESSFTYLERLEDRYGEIIGIPAALRSQIEGNTGALPGAIKLRFIPTKVRAEEYQKQNSSSTDRDDQGSSPPPGGQSR